MTKIISFCVYGNNPKYVHSALKNISIAEDVYPGWTCRIYADKNIPQEVMKDLNDSPAQVVIKEPVQGHLGMFWRFEPLKDRSIERFIVRDTDSRLNEREADAVREWEESGAEFHIIRDHYYHGARIIGGLWGATDKFIAKIADKFDEMLDNYMKGLGANESFMHVRGPFFNTDQPFLWKYIWPLIVNTHMAHIKPNIQQLKFTGREKLLRIELSNGGFCGQDLEYES